MEEEKITISKAEYDELVKTKLRKKQYYQNITKNNIYHCQLCEIDLSQGSMSNHTRSKKHVKNTLAFDKLNVEEL